MSDVEVTAEPLTYDHGAPWSYFRDLIKSSEDRSADARLQRHAAEMRVELPKLEARARLAEGVEYRVNPNHTLGQGGFASPPLWLIEAAAGAPRAGRVLANRMPTFSLPKGVSSVNAPRLVASARTGQATDGAAVPSQDLTDALVSSPVVPIAGSSDISIQSLDQSPVGAHFDHAIFLDLAGDYDAQLEAMLINGTGANGQILGLLNVPAGAGLASLVTYTDANPTPAELFPFVGQAFAQLGDARSLPPEVWLARSARWAWIASSDVNLLTAEPRLIGRPVELDDAIATTVGGPGRDAMVACRPSDMLLLESNITTRVMPEPLSGTLQVRLQLLGYVAALVARYPTGIATIQGSGMTVQPGF